MSKQTYDEEELQLMQDLENDVFIEVENNEQEIKKLITAAKNTYNKRKAISIRPLATDIFKIQSKAIKEWIPYQTLITSIIHKYANNELVSK